MSSVTVTIHRGSHEIGGNCVELATAKSRLILDVGMPLSEMTTKRASQKPEIRKEDLMDRGVIVPISGLFTSGPKIDAILLSHAHGDHTGLVNYTEADTPVYMSQGTSKMLMAGNLFAGQPRIAQGREKRLPSGKPISLGDFRVSSYPVDHSAYGSVAFLIEVNGKRLLYSGDLRMHGRKPGMAAALLAAARQSPLDLLIMEGTSLSRSKTRGPTEKNLERRLVSSLRKIKGLALVMFSPQNVDRLVTLFRAALQTRRTLVLDPYSAFVLYLIHRDCAVPHPFRHDAIRIFAGEDPPSSSPTRRLLKLCPAAKSRLIPLEEILAAPGQHLMVFRERMYERIFHGKLPPASALFYSYWSGYLEEASLKQLRSKIETTGHQFELLHVSGHLYYPDVMEFVHLANPEKIMPVHTTAPSELVAAFPGRVVASSTYSLA